ncbi:hypothetical protein [Massilia sp. 9096]|uniref:hypothetical protein n=1 Tax=Massilia sp. 9096 TaxID=1500894 RepID=UPI00055B169C|nr:hypothetical protein [Massilia sp. 9096]
MKRSTLRAGLALACALGLSACGGGSGDLYLTGQIYGGVTADGLILQNNGGDDLAVPAGATTFQFGNRISTDDEFSITVKQAPANSSVDKCVVSNGHARANYYTIGQISVSCAINQIAMTVTVNGLTGAGLTLVNGSDKKDVAAGTPSVVMAPVFQDGPYAVKVLNQPVGQTCNVSGGDTGTGAGTVGATPVTSVVVTCTNNAAST